MYPGQSAGRFVTPVYKALQTCPTPNYLRTKFYPLFSFVHTKNNKVILELIFALYFRKHFSQFFLSRESLRCEKKLEAFGTILLFGPQRPLRKIKRKQVLAFWRAISENIKTITYSGKGNWLKADFIANVEHMIWLHYEALTFWIKLKYIENILSLICK